MSEEVVIAQKAPYATDVEQGKTYYWCACGRSKNQPFCDGSHQGTGIEPVAFTAEKSEKAWLCGCKKSGTPPFCDGTHNKL
ncbi:MAG: CDGSH iron-sulfur domain-containing protein [Gammaproteobacteria bacterium]|jgi:CDGSH-type Zn-finger protein